MNKAL